MKQKTIVRLLFYFFIDFITDSKQIVLTLFCIVNSFFTTMIAFITSNFDLTISNDACCMYTLS